MSCPRDTYSRQGDSRWNNALMLVSMYDVCMYAEHGLHLHRLSMRNYTPDVVEMEVVRYL